MHSFEVSLGYESVDRATFSTWSTTALHWKCTSVNAFIPQWNFKRMHSILEYLWIIKLKNFPVINLIVLFRLIRGIMFISTSFTRMAQSGWKSKFINCFRNVITCLSINVRKFTSWISGKLCFQACLSCFIEYLHRKLLAANVLSYDIESAKEFTY
jgi:hypothetical protein